jgi:hypothetical protein
VFGYNWLLRQNKLAFEGVRSFGAQLHSLLLATTDLTAPVEQAAAPVQPDTGFEPNPEEMTESDTEPASISIVTPINQA